MGRARQTITVTKNTTTKSTTTRQRSRVNKPTQSNNKRGNKNHCPTCGKFV